MNDRQRVIGEVMAELDRAMGKHAPMNSAHEGYAVILEELDEAWAEIKANNAEGARREMTQVAAMALRFLFDVCASVKGGQEQ